MREVEEVTKKGGEGIRLKLKNPLRRGRAEEGLGGWQRREGTCTEKNPKKSLKKDDIRDWGYTQLSTEKVEGLRRRLAKRTSKNVTVRKNSIAVSGLC